MELFVNLTLSATLPPEESELNVGIPTDVQVSYREMLTITHLLQKLSGLTDQEKALIRGFVDTVTAVMHREQVTVMMPAGVSSNRSTETVISEGDGAVEV